MHIEVYEGTVGAAVRVNLLVYESEEVNDGCVRREQPTCVGVEGGSEEVMEGSEGRMCLMFNGLDPDFSSLFSSWSGRGFSGSRKELWCFLCSWNARIESFPPKAISVISFACGIEDKETRSE